MQESVKKKDYFQITKLLPKLQELIEGKVIEIGRNEIYLDLNGITTGVVRGIELLDESGDFSNLKKGDKISATVIELENEKGLVELSFRSASHKKTWNKLEEMTQNKENIKVKVTAANKGGLIVKYGEIQGFLPVSQLAKRLGRQVNLKARAYGEQYIIDMEHKRIYSPGLDGQSHTKDDIILFINPEVINFTN